MTLAASMLASFAHHGARAQVLPDPTRPPASLGARADGASAADGQPRLQSVLIARGGRQVAVIEGETVRLGDSYKGARVARMTQTEVELVRGRERQVLRLEPQPLGAAGTESSDRGITPAN